MCAYDVDRYDDCDEVWNVAEEDRGGWEGLGIVDGMDSPCFATRREDPRDTSTRRTVQVIWDSKRSKREGLSFSQELRTVRATAITVLSG